MGVLKPYAFTDLLSFSRASLAFDFNAAGVLEQAAIDALRTDFDPATLAPRGWLLEPASTNGVRNPRGEAAVVGSPGTLPTNWSGTVQAGVTRDLVGFGVEDGIPYVDFRWFGTPGAGGNCFINFEPATQVSAAVGEVWSMSCYVRLVAGAVTNATFSQRIQENDGGGASLVGGVLAVAAPTAAALRTQRPAITRTLSNAGTAFVRPSYAVNVSSGQAIDLTLRIGVPQLEKYDTASSPLLPPAGAPAAFTRAGDSLQLQQVPLWWNAAAGTIIVDFVLGRSVPPTATPFLRLDDGTDNEQFVIRQGSGATQIRCVSFVGGVQVDNLLAGNATLGVASKVAYSFGAAGTFCSLNGGAAAQGSGAQPANISRGFVGRNDAAGTGFGGWIRAVRFKPKQYTTSADASDGLTISTV